MKNRNILISSIVAGSLMMACNQKPVVDETALGKMVEEKVMAAIDAKQTEWNAKIEAAANAKADSIIAAMPKAKTGGVKTPAKPVVKPKPTSPKPTTTTTTVAPPTPKPSPTPTQIKADRMGGTTNEVNPKTPEEIKKAAEEATKSKANKMGK
jgi:cell division septation protein DedD